MTTPPMTLRVKALLRYINECEEGGEDLLNTYDTCTTCGDGFLRTLLVALERL